MTRIRMDIDIIPGHWMRAIVRERRISRIGSGAHGRTPHLNHAELRQQQKQASAAAESSTRLRVRLRQITDFPFFSRFSAERNTLLGLKPEYI